jgi:hypothetical protein
VSEYYSFRVDTVMASFGDAIEACKRNLRIGRRAWGKNVWVTISCNKEKVVESQYFWSFHNAQYAKSIGGSAIVTPSFTLKREDGKIQMGWIPTIEDMLADDWIIYPD